MLTLSLEPEVAQCFVCSDICRDINELERHFYRLHIPRQHIFWTIPDEYRYFSVIEDHCHICPVYDCDLLVRAPHNIFNGSILARHLFEEHAFRIFIHAVQYNIVVYSPDVHPEQDLPAGLTIEFIEFM